MHISKLAIIGGTSLLESDLFKGGTPITVDTPYGSVTLLSRGETLFLQRHGLESYTPPHQINHHANLKALQMAGASHILSVGSVGGMRPETPPGRVLIPDDFFAPNLAPTFFEDAQGHQPPGFNLPWRRALLALWQQSALPSPIDGGVYWQTTGPRFETPAEISFYQPHVHVVGMTVASETILAGELNLPLAALCMIDNYANGVSDETLTFQSFKAQVRANEAQLVHIIQTLMGTIAP
ncbi:MAG: MTAP family purine nucleoside phosphorylase [Magnetococcales bacterium]|nr:MTAP family purine nucleoside phosphorylase [Magnetococcales bacterium]